MTQAVSWCIGAADSARRYASLPRTGSASYPKSMQRRRCASAFASLLTPPALSLLHPPHQQEEKRYSCVGSYMCVYVVCRTRYPKWRTALPMPAAMLLPVSLPVTSTSTYNTTPQPCCCTSTIRSIPLGSPTPRTCLLRTSCAHARHLQLVASEDVSGESSNLLSPALLRTSAVCHATAWEGTAQQAASQQQRYTERVCHKGCCAHEDSRYSATKRHMELRGHATHCPAVSQLTMARVRVGAASPHLAVPRVLDLALVAGNTLCWSCVALCDTAVLVRLCHVSHACRKGRQDIIQHTAPSTDILTAHGTVGGMLTDVHRRIQYAPR